MTRSALIAIATLLALTACGGSKTPTAAPSLDTVVGSSPTPATTGASPAASGSSSDGTASPKPSATSGQQSGPKIEYFRIKTKPSCPSSGPGASFPGNDIVLEWKVAGGPTQVTVSIDGPGLFGTYTATDEQAFPFACSGASNTIQKHKYTLKTVGGTVKQAELTGEARVN